MSRTASPQETRVTGETNVDGALGPLGTRCSRSIRRHKPCAGRKQRLNSVARVATLCAIAYGVGCTATRLDMIAENRSESSASGDSSGGTLAGGTGSDPATGGSLGSTADLGANSGGVSGTASTSTSGTGGVFGVEGAGAGPVESVVPFPVDQTRTECTKGTNPGYGTYHLRLHATQSCLAAGTYVVIAENESFKLDAYELEMVEPCNTSSAQSWFLGSPAGQYAFQLFNDATKRAIDIKSQNFAAGTELILIWTTYNDSQRFFLNSRGDGTFGLANKAAGHCMTATEEGAEIQPCDATNPQQSWEFLPDYCGL